MAVSVYKRERSPFYYALITHNGRVLRKSTEETTKREADKKAQRLFTKYVQGIARGQLEAGRRVKRITLADFAREYLEDATKRHVKGHRTINRERSFLNFATRHLGSRPVAGIARKDIEGLIGSYLAEGKSDTTVNMLVRHLKAIFQRAIEWQFTDRNPCKGISMITVPKHLPRYLKEDQYQAVLEKAEAHSDRMHFYFLLGIYAGLRRAEIANTRWEWFDFERKVIQVESDDNGFTTKNRKVRTVPMHNRIKEVLGPAAKPEGYVFETSGQNTQNDSIRFQPRKSFHRICQAAGLPDDVTPHWLRHTFGTMLAQKGISVYKIKEWMGHSDIKTTEIYLHLAGQDEDINALS